MASLLADEVSPVDRAGSKGDGPVVSIKPVLPLTPNDLPSLSPSEQSTGPSEPLLDHAAPTTDTTWAGLKGNLGSNDRVDTGKIFPRISLPVELMRNEYDVVVIGSGYGGGVAASRMARGHQSVCLLEVGKERWRRSIFCSELVTKV